MNGRKVVAAVVAAFVMLVGGVAVGGAAEAGTPHAKVCVSSKAGWKVPSRSLALCDAVAGQAQYKSGASGYARGTALVLECRADGRSEAREYGRKAGDEYVTSCLWGQHRDWLLAQPRK